MNLLPARAFLLVPLLFVAAATSAPAQDSYIYTIRAGIRELFLDDHHLGSVYNLERRVHPVRKQPGGPVVWADQPWEKTSAGENSFSELVEYYGAPGWDPDEGVWKMWYVIGDGKRAAYARSRDGVGWEKPNLGIVQYEGSGENNLVMVQGDPRALIVHVLMDPNAPAERRYVGLCWVGRRGREAVASSDGYVFRKLGYPPIPGQDTSHLNYDEKGGRFLLTVKHPGPFGRSVYLSLSRDLREWTPHELIFHADLRDQELGRERIRTHLSDPGLHTPTYHRPQDYRTEIYNMPVFPYESLYIGLPTFFEAAGLIPLPRGNQDGFNSVKLASSRDLKRWNKVGRRESFIPVSRLSEGRLDTVQILAASRPVVKEKELWFYYSGIKERFTPDGVYHGAIFLAKLRRDGFVSFRAGAEEGFVETRPIRFQGDRLFCNVDARGGELTVEVVPPSRRRTELREWAGKRSRPIRGDRLEAEVTWEGRDDLRELNGKVLRLRFHLTDADLYSFWSDSGRKP